jgi:hypothetical protein
MGINARADAASKELPSEHGERLLSDLELVEVALSGQRRDTWTGEIGGKTVLLSGGLSWGDVPTEAFEALNRLSLAGVTSAMGFDW